MSEQPIPSLSDVATSVGVKDSLGSLRERFHKPLAGALKEAKSEAAQRLQGQELMQAVSSSWTAEQKAAANADQHKEEVGVHKTSTRQEILGQAKVMTKLALGADIGKLSPEETSIIKGEGGDWRGSAQSWLESYTKMQEELVALSEARGTLPGESLAKEQRYIEGVELAEAHETLDGERILRVLKTEGAVNDLDQLGTAVNIGESMERARKNGIHHLSKLHERLLRRYPGQKEEIDIKYNNLANERSVTLKGFEFHIKPGEVAAEEVKTQVEHILQSANLRREENKAVLLATLGIQVEGEKGEQVYTLTEDSPIASVLKDVSLLELQTQDLEKAIEKAEADPRLADVALTIALTRYTTREFSRLTLGQIGQAVQIARINESVQIAKERAAAEKSAAWNRVKGFVTRARFAAMKTSNAVAGGAAQALGKTIRTIGVVAAFPGNVTALAGNFLNKRAELNRQWAAGGIASVETTATEQTSRRAEELQSQIEMLTAELNALNVR